MSSDEAVKNARDYLAERLSVPLSHLTMIPSHVLHLAQTMRMADERKLRLFFLLDTRYRLKRPRLSNRSAELMVFWAPGDNGYSNSLTWAGRYTAERLTSGTNYYRLGPGKDARTWALPVDSVMKLAIHKPEPLDRRHCDGPGPILVNHIVVWELLETLAVGEEQMRAIASEEASRT